MNKKIISILAIVLFGAGLTYAAEQPGTAKTKCYKGIVEIPCPQPEDDSSGKDVQVANPPLPHISPGNKIIQDNASDLMRPKAVEPRKDSSGKDAQVAKPLLSDTDPDNGTIQDNATDLARPKATEPREGSSGKDVQVAKPLLPHNDPDNGTIQDNATDLARPKAVEPRDDSSGKDAQDFKPLLPYTDPGNGVIQDNFTGLMWQKATAPGIGSGPYPDRYTWDQANAYCAGLSLGGYTDWRLPDVNELQSLVDYSRHNPSINTTYFPKTRASRYWSSTMFSNDIRGVWYVSFYYGYACNCIKGSHYYVRAVRSGQ